MSLGSSEAKEVVATLRDRLKHGQNMTKILESQLDTAQQNISLLQGQVRLANETILNLKKYFTETENTLNDLFTSNYSSSASRGFQYNDGPTKEQSDIDKHSQTSKVSRNSTRSPRTPESAETKVHHEEKHREREHHNKSPYAQQLRQVLDALQDEEPKKTVHNHHRVHEKKEQSEHSPSPPPTDCRLMQATKHYHDNEGGAFQRRSTLSEEDYSKIKHHKMNGHSSRETTNGNHDPISPKSSYYQQHRSSELAHGHHQSHSHSNHCMGPCCPNNTPPASYKMLDKTYHYGADENPTHYVEKSPNGSLHYIAVHSPESSGSSGKHDRHLGHHYVPYAYHIPGENSHKAIHEMATQPLSPTISNGGGSGRRKRAYAPLLPNEEPPHLKYTKVKRIDGSKLTAQKVLQDFTKRRFIPYNPRYDLDLLIVPPPIPASDLLKGGHQFKSGNKKMSSIQSPIPPPSENEAQKERRSILYGKHSSEENPDKDEEVFTEPRSPLSDTNNNNHHDDNNNKTMNNNTWPHKPHLYSGKSVSVLPSIKEEPRSHKLEDQINRLRGDQEASLPSVYRQQENTHNDSNNNGNGSLIRENTASPIPLVHRPTEQFCT